MHSNVSLAELPSLDEIREERARRSFDCFARRMLGLEPARHHRFVNEKLEAVERGEIKRLMLFEPPGHAKSTYASTCFRAGISGATRRRALLRPAIRLNSPPSSAVASVISSI